MSQPFDRACCVAAPGIPDQTLDQFWEDDPWRIMMRHNQSAYERNRAYLNIGGETFLDMSYLTGADADGDHRAVAAGDFNNDGRMDLMVRGVGGGALLLFENKFPPRSYLKVSLRGTKSNRLGIGARLTAWTGEQSQIRELYPSNHFSSQDPSIAHFGLGDAMTVDRLTIQWPSGSTQEFHDVPTAQHIIIHEDLDDYSTVTPGRTITR